MTQFPMEVEGQQIAVSVPLFLRKLWKMVNDQEAERIIGWNLTGDGFIIYDQLQFMTKLLPKYFKHNNMASFIRQLNFYDFHKVSSIDKDEIQFSHNCFLKDLPETLVFIRRKCTSLRNKLTNNIKDEELTDILNGVKQLKNKHDLVDNELKMLKRENAALWNEVNNLRLKHAKQTKIINKIIHFLISYIHSHQNSLSKGKVAVGRRDSKNLKTGPTILEIGYHSSFDDEEIKTKPSSYAVTEPEQSAAVSYPASKLGNISNMQTEGIQNEMQNLQSEHSRESVYLSSNRDKCLNMNTKSTLDGVSPTINQYKKAKSVIKSETTNKLMGKLQPGCSGSMIYPTSEVPLNEMIIHDKANQIINPHKKCKRSAVTEYSKTNLLENLQSDLLEDDSNSLDERNLTIGNSQGVSNSTLGNSPIIKTERMEDAEGPKYKNTFSGNVKSNILPNPRENLGLFIDDTQEELNSLQDILNNLSSIDIANFCNLIEETDAESLREIDDKLDETNAQETDNQSNSEANFIGSDDFLKDSLVEQFYTGPVEHNTVIPVPNANDLEGTTTLDVGEPEVLVDEYFTI